MTHVTRRCRPLQAEAKQNNSSMFRSHLLNRLQKEFKSREQMRKRSILEWVCYVSFICNIFDYLKVKPVFYLNPFLKAYLFTK